MQRNIFIGYDSREADAYRACVNSLRKNSAPGFMLQPINWRFLGTLYKRLTFRNDKGVLFDAISEAPMATEFSLARFWVPVLQPTGWALFCDCDFMFRAPIEELFALADKRFAVMVVKHNADDLRETKMDNQPQTRYPKKNWSSLMLLNCSLINSMFPHGFGEVANTVRGLQLHQFEWLPPGLVGDLPADWNHLVDVSPPHANPRGVHFTLGVPSMVGYENVPFADEWRSYATR